MTSEPTKSSAGATEVLILRSQSSEDTSQNEEDNSSSLSASENNTDDAAQTSIENSTPSESLKVTNASLHSARPAGELPEPLTLAPGEDIDIRYDDVSLRGKKDFVDPEVQECRARLRERFMWAVTGLNGKQVTVDMMDSLCVSGVLRGIDKDGLMIHVENLKTPTATHPWATLRMPDCLALHFTAT